MQDKLGSPSDNNIHSQGESARHEEESQASVHEHHHDTSAAQSKISTTTLTAATSSMTSALTNYNVNVQFDPSTPQAAKPNHLSLIVTEQKVVNQSKILISCMTNLCI
jgi:hypothetical protein